MNGTLTPRELEISRLQAAGRRPKEIAAELGVADKTVNIHLLHAYKKLGVKRRAEFMRVADQMGLRAAG